MALPNQPCRRKPSLVPLAPKPDVMQISMMQKIGVEQCQVDPEVPENLLHMVPRGTNLNKLSAPFTEKEIDQVVALLPIDKAPGPDGFNGCFMKSCWNIIKFDFYKLLNEFHEANISLKPLNDLLITLISKKCSPETPNDFWPISLLNSALKLLTKLLANRLQEVILELVRKN
jgi:hypothetical protein